MSTAGIIVVGLVLLWLITDRRITVRFVSEAETTELEPPPWTITHEVDGTTTIESVEPELHIIVRGSSLDQAWSALESQIEAHRMCRVERWQRSEEVSLAKRRKSA